MALSVKYIAFSSLAVAVHLIAGCGDAPQALVADEVAEPKSEPSSSSDQAIEPVKFDRDGLDWPQFLGPDGTGITREEGELLTLDEQAPPIRWQLDVGEGYSAPAVRGRRLVLHHRIRNEEIIDCLDAATGERIWRHVDATDFRDPYGYNGGPRCSPLLTESHCYTFGAGGLLTCLELESGETVWQINTAKRYDVPEAFFGVGCTPVLHDDLLIVLVGGQPDYGVVAFNAETGDEVWHAVGKPTWDGVKTESGETYEWTGEEMLVSYSSPIIREIHGQPHLLCLMRQGLVSLDPNTGDERFKYWFRARVHESVNAARPVVAGDRVLLSAAYRVGSALLEINEPNDESPYDVVWRDPRNLLAHWSTPIVVQDHAYGFSGRHESEGELRCIELKTDDVVWSIDGSENAVPGQREPYPYFGRGSMIHVEPEKTWIILGERGTLAVAKLSPEGYEELGRTSFEEIGYPAWTAPVLSRGLLYLRDEDALLCVNVRTQQKD